MSAEMIAEPIPKEADGASDNHSHSVANMQNAGFMSRLHRWCCLPRWMGPTGKEGHMEDVVEKVVTDDHLDEYHDAGAPCEICNDDDQVKTHFARPCRHALCESCWTSWLDCSTKCPICGVVVTGTQRFNSSLVPLRHYEMATRSAGGSECNNLPYMYNLNAEIEKNAEQTINSLVQAKDAFESISTRITEVSTHLTNLVSEGLDLETRLSIVAVEKSTVAEQFDALARVMEDRETSPWTSANSALEAFTAAINELSAELDKEPDEPPSGLSSTQSLLFNCTVTMLRGQWQPLRSALTELTQTQIPQVLQQLAHAQHPLTQPQELQAMQRAVQMLQQQAQGRICITENLMQRLLPELEVATVRVASMF